MKKATYTLTDGSKKIVEYDENAPCIVCGLPVVEASMGGTDLCPWCDCGNYRDGTKFTFREETNRNELKKKAKEISERLNNEEDCPVCHGAGATTDHHDPCTECGGSGKVGG